MSGDDVRREGRRELRTAQVRRDIGLARLTALTRWAVAGAAILTGAFAVAAARAFPAGAAHRSAPPASQAVSRDATASGALQPPAQAPTPSSAPSVVSGGS